MSQQLDFNLEEGRRLRDEGIEQVEDNSADWKDRALVAAKITRINWTKFGPFMAEDLRPDIVDLAGEPHHPNCWGALTMNLVRNGIIEKTGQYDQCRIKSSHARVNPLYRWADQK